LNTITRAAARDFNDNVASIREASLASSASDTTLISVVECGWGSTDRVRRIIVNEHVAALHPMAEHEYSAKGHGTPLFDSIGELIEIFEAEARLHADASFLVMAVTDGMENRSRKYDAYSISQKIKQLQGTDRWTFVFRVPRGGKRELMGFGIPEGNILEWDQTERGVQAATVATRAAFAQYYTDRAQGKTSTKSFYADLSKVSSTDIQTSMADISSDVLLWPVSKAEAGTAIRTFVEKRLNGEPLLKGAAFYQLVKTEKEVQDHKRIIIRDKKTNAIYEGAAARQMMGLPSYGTIKLSPSNLGNFDLFIQSTSVNRKVDANTQVLYWKKIGIPYKEGPSARGHR
jgi:hypothetical protein